MGVFDSSRAAQYGWPQEVPLMPINSGFPRAREHELFAMREYLSTTFQRVSAFSAG